MLRHACGFALANKGHDTRTLQAYLGYRNIQCVGLMDARCIGGIFRFQRYQLLCFNRTVGCLVHRIPESCFTVDPEA
jgi:hypothetical protein